MTTVIGLSGWAGCGKDEAARALVADGWRRVSFADVLREFALSLNPAIPVGVRHGAGYVRLQRLIEIVGWERAKREHPEVRALLQRLGTDAGRRLLGDDVWIDAALRSVGEHERIVCPDVRFPNELAAVRARGGLCVRIERAGVRAVNAHVSESALDGVTDWDAVLANDGSVEDLHARIRTIAAGRDASTPTA